MTKLIDSEYWHDDGKEYTLASRIGVLIEIGALTGVRVLDQSGAN